MLKAFLQFRLICFVLQIYRCILVALVLGFIYFLFAVEISQKRRNQSTIPLQLKNYWVKYAFSSGTHVPWFKLKDFLELIFFRFLYMVNIRILRK